MLIPSDRLLNVGQNAGESPTAKMNRDFLLAHPLVSVHPIFSLASNWRKVFFVFKHKASTKKLIAGFSSFDESNETAMRIRPGIVNEMEFGLQKIILLNTEGTTLIIRSNSISDISSYDFILGHFELFGDRNPPTATLALSTSGTLNTQVDLTVTFSESVDSFDASKLQITNGSASFVSKVGNVYTFQLTPSDQGAVTAKVEAGVCADSAGNLNNSSNTVSFIYDSVSPSITIVSSPVLSSNPAIEIFDTFTVTATFSESGVTGFDSTDVTVTNGSVSNFTGSGTTYTFDVTPTANGLGTVKILSEKATDAAGNLNTESNLLSFSYTQLQNLIVPVGTTMTLSPGVKHRYRSITISGTLLMEQVTSSAYDVGVFCQLTAVETFTLNSTGSIVCKTNAYYDSAGQREISDQSFDGKSLLFSYPTAPVGGQGGRSWGPKINGIFNITYGNYNYVGPTRYGNGGGGGASYAADFPGYTPQGANGALGLGHGFNGPGGTGGYGLGTSGSGGIIGKGVYGTPPGSSGGGGGGARGYWGLPFYLKAKNVVINSGGKIYTQGGNGGNGGWGADQNYSQNGWSGGYPYSSLCGGGGGGGAGGHGAPVTIDYTDSYTYNGTLVPTYVMTGGTGGAGGLAGNFARNNSQGAGSAGGSGSAGTLTLTKI